jgi:hypothetical protein
VTTPLKAIPHQNLKKIFQTVAASLGYVRSCWRGVLRRWPLSVSCEYRGYEACNKIIPGGNFTAIPRIQSPCQWELYKEMDH